MLQALAGCDRNPSLDKNRETFLQTFQVKYWRGHLRASGIERIKPLLQPGRLQVAKLEIQSNLKII